VTVAVTFALKVTEALGTPMHHWSVRVTVTEALWPARSRPLPLALMVPTVPVTRQLIGPPLAVTFTEQ
jgi:hypothetical protein